MFGHQDTRRKDDSQPIENLMSDDTAAQVAAAADTSQQPAAPAQDFNPALPPEGHNPFAGAANPAPANDTATGQPADQAQEDPAQIDIPVPVVGNEAYSTPGQVNSSPLSQHLATAAPYTPSDTPVDAPATTDQPTQAPAADDSGLLSIKQQALTQLSPLVGHLEQSPEEKFRTTMMMIQANDDQSLIQSAYEAANAITDEKAKAQALLDIVNEINYFTHQGHNQQS